MKSFKQFVIELNEEQSTEYRGEHEAPGPGSGSPLHDLKGAYPDDFHSSEGARYYGTGSKYDGQSHSLLRSLKGKPNASVKIYRAVPHEPSHDEKIDAAETAKKHFMKTGKMKGVEPHIKSYDDLCDHVDKLKATRPAVEPGKPKINPGDWVSISKEYAHDHGHEALKGKFKILSKTVKAHEVYTSGDSMHEQGYHPSKK